MFNHFGDMPLKLSGYHNSLCICRDDSPKGGVVILVKDIINYKIPDDISVFIPHVFESNFGKFQISLLKMK